MRNLKRALSLLLAAAMLIGMMVVGASAVSYNDFPDRDEIVNKDAVSMLTTLGIIEGTDQGTYNPTGDVDRAQMAKMISVALTNNEDCDTLYQNVNSGLTDIAANWARGYINYCYTLGIIAGRGNNTFDPSANVTGVEAAKMLLAALGYDAEIEGLVGTDWALNTAALAQNLGIFRNFTKDVSEPLNRDDAALLIYNALDVELIQEYRNGYAISYDDHRTILSSVFGVMRVEGVVVANEWAQLQETDSDAALREGRTTLDQVIVYDSTTANTVVPEGVRQDDPVTFNVSTPVEYIGKAVTMYVEKTTILSNSVVIGVATDDDANVINFTAEGQNTVKDYLKGTGVSVSDDETAYYVNYGYFKNEDAAIDWINEYHHTEAAGNDFSLNGIEVQVIDNDDDGVAEYVLYLQETLSEVGRYNERNETLTFYTPDRLADDQLDGTTSTATIDLADMVSAEKVSLEGVTTAEDLALEAEDLILYVQYGGRTYISLPEIVTGKMTRVDRDRDDELYITVNDATYYQSYILDAASLVDVDISRFIIEEAREDVGFDTTYDFILDSNGYVVAVRPAEEVVTNYALVLDSAWTQNALTRGGEVKVLKADGTEATYDINWKESAKAFTGIDSIKAADDVKGETNDVKLEYYLGSRDVHDDTGNTGYRTGRAAGSIIVYSLNEAGDELTIEQVLQGNVFEDDADLDDTVEIETESTKVDVTDTAGVADNGDVIFMDGDPDTNNLQYVATTGYDNGYGRITVKGSTLNADTAARTVEKTYAVDLNTVAFYYYDPEQDGEDVEYGVATGWDKMSDVADGTDVQVYPVLEKTTNRTYKASNLAGVILFEAEPNTVAANYMLVLSANAVGKDLLELNVVFEDGTAETIKVDDQGDSFDEDDPDCFMKAWTYSENADGTYDIGSMADKWGTADLLITGTIDLNNGDYLALPSTAKVWDVTEVENANDTVATGRFQENVYVNAVIIVSEGQVRTAWVWDLDEDQTIGSGYNFNWTLTNYEDVYPYLGTWSQWQIQQYLIDGINVRVIGDLTLTGDLYIPEGTILQVEGSLYDGTGAAAGDHFAINGNGTLRVRNDFTVYSGVINVNTQVGDTVGDDLLLGANTTINSRVGVYGDIIGNTVNSGTGHSANRGFNLTVGTGGSVYANRDVEVYYLTVNGHIEANDYHIVGGEINSARTLIALGSITLYGGELKLGDTATGNATVNGKISGTGDLNVNDGTLTLTRSGSINLVGDVSVGSKGTITQLNGTTHHIVVDGNAYINGKVTIPGTIKATGDVYFGSTANVTLVGDPTGATVTKDPNAKVTIIGGGTDIPEVPEQPVDPADKAVISAAVTFANPVKGEAMPTTATVVADPAGSVTASAITWTPADETAVAGTEYTATLTLTAGEGYKFDATSNVTVNGSAAAVSGDVKAINVTYKYTVPEEGTDPEPVADVTAEITGDKAPYAITLNYTGAAPELPADEDAIVQAINKALTEKGETLMAGIVNPTTGNDLANATVWTADGKTKIGTITVGAGTFTVYVNDSSVGTVSTSGTNTSLTFAYDGADVLVKEDAAGVTQNTDYWQANAWGEFTVSGASMTEDLYLVPGYKFVADSGNSVTIDSVTLPGATSTTTYTATYYYPVGTTFAVTGKIANDSGKAITLSVGENYKVTRTDGTAEQEYSIVLSADMLDKDSTTTCTVSEAVSTETIVRVYGTDGTSYTDVTLPSNPKGSAVEVALGSYNLDTTADYVVLLDGKVMMDSANVVNITREQSSTGSGLVWKFEDFTTAIGGGTPVTEGDAEYVLVPSAEVTFTGTGSTKLIYRAEAFGETESITTAVAATKTFAVPVRTTLTVMINGGTTGDRIAMTLTNGSGKPETTYSKGDTMSDVGVDYDDAINFIVESTVTPALKEQEITSSTNWSGLSLMADAQSTNYEATYNPEMAASGTVSADDYKFEVTLEAADGYYFAADTEIESIAEDSGTTIAFNVDPDTVEVSADGKTLTFTVTFTVA